MQINWSEISKTQDGKTQECVSCLIAGFMQITTQPNFVFQNENRRQQNISRYQNKMKSHSLLLKMCNARVLSTWATGEGCKKYLEMQLLS